MARTLLSPVQPTRGGTGTDITAVNTVDTANKNYIVNDGKLRVLIKTGGTGDTVTFAFNGTNNTVDGVSATPPPYVLAASKTVYAGPFDTSVYGTTLNVDAGVATTQVIPLG